MQSSQSNAVRNGAAPFFCSTVPVVHFRLTAKACGICSLAHSGVPALHAFVGPPADCAAASMDCGQHRYQGSRFSQWPNAVPSTDV